MLTKTMRLIAVGLVAFSVQSARAEWKEQSVVLEVHTSDQAEIGQTLFQFQHLMPYLASMSLASPKKLVVSRLEGKLSNFKWYNDETCSVSNPDSVPLVGAENGAATFYYHGTPDEAHGAGIGTMILPPCAPGGARQAFQFRQL